MLFRQPPEMLDGFVFAARAEQVPAFCYLVFDVCRI